MDIKGHVAVVTGAGRGIGTATALMLAAEGAKIVVWDRDIEPAPTVAEKLVYGTLEALRGHIQQAVLHVLAGRLREQRMNLR